MATHLHFFYVAHIRVKQYKIKQFYILMKDHEENFEDTVHGWSMHYKTKANGFNFMFMLILSVCILRGSTSIQHDCLKNTKIGVLTSPANVIKYGLQEFIEKLL